MNNNQSRALVQLSKHTFVYRGFTIHKCPRHSETSRTAYQLMSNGIISVVISRWQKPCALWTKWLKGGGKYETALQNSH
jgi:hypothetical protein